MENPNYSKYSLDELFDALNHIDKQQYPKHFYLLESEIIKRSKKKKKVETINEIKNPNEFLVNNSIHYFRIGILVILTILFLVFALQKPTSDKLIFLPLIIISPVSDNVSIEI